MNESIPPGWHSVTPRLVSDEPEKLVVFLRDAFGAEGTMNADRPSVMRIGDSIVMVSASGPRAASTASYYLYVPDVEETYRKALQAGATSIEAPAIVPYGDRRAIVRDPSGNEWQLATYLGSPNV